MPTGAERTAGRPIATIAAPPLLLVTPFVIFLRHHAYSVTQPEIVLCLLTMILTGAGLALAGLRWPKLGIAVLAILITAFVDVQFEFDVPIPGIGKTKLLVAMLLGLYLILSRLGAHAFQITAVMTSTILVSTVLLPAGRLSWVDGGVPFGDRRLPFVLHVVLDEHIGVEGLRAANPQGAGELREFFANRGFRLLGGAYSQYALTTDSLGQVLNLIPGQQLSGEVIVSNGVAEYELTRGAYFDRMAEAGYGMRIYQTEWLDLCHAVPEPHGCETFGVTRLGMLQAQPLSILQKLAVVAGTYVARTDVGPKLFRLYDIGTRPVVRDSAPRVRQRLGTTPYSTLAGAAMFNRLTADLAHAERGQLFLAHVMLPHYPYMYDAECGLLPPEKWLTRDDPSALDVTNTPQGRALRYDRYVEQLRCTLRHVGELIDAIPASLRADAVVVIHGDHGSRIALLDPLESRHSELVASDFVDSYSTLFAIRSQGIRAGYEEARVSVACALKALVEAAFQSLDGIVGCAATPTVFILDRGRGFTEWPLPSAGHETR